MCIYTRILLNIIYNLIYALIDCFNLLMIIPTTLRKNKITEIIYLAQVCFDIIKNTNEGK